MEERWSRWLVESGSYAQNFGWVFVVTGHDSLSASWILYQFASFTTSCRPGRACTSISWSLYQFVSLSVMREIREAEGIRAQELPAPPEVRLPKPYGCGGTRHRLAAEKRALNLLAWARA